MNSSGDGGTSPTTHSASSSLKACQPSSGPSRHRRTRTAPVRSLSTPLTRSLSMREPSALRYCRSGGGDASTTYRDDYRSPEAIVSYKLHSLNLETSVKTLLDPPTTYRDSFQWPPSWASRRGARSDAAGNGNNNKVKDAAVAAANNCSKGSHSGFPFSAGRPNNSQSKSLEGLGFRGSVQSDTMNHASANPSARRPVFLGQDSFRLMRNENCDKVSPTRNTPSSEEAALQTKR